MIRKLINAVTPSRADFGIKWSDEWKELHHGTVYRFLKETDKGVKIMKSCNEAYRHMETGEIAVIERKDAKVEWFEHHNRREWPDYVGRAMREGYTWYDYDLDGMPELWGSIISHSPTSLWKRVDGVEPPRSVR